jgi:hypothetical protein
LIIRNFTIAEYALYTLANTMLGANEYISRWGIILELLQKVKV